MGLLRKLVEPPLRALGVEPIPHWELADFAHAYVHAQLLREVFDLKGIDCVFDVGAFTGHFGHFLRRKVGFEGTILSFEPQPGPFRELEEACRKDGHWHAFPVALGVRSGEFEMNVMNKPKFSSFLPPSTATTRSMASENTVESTIRARIERLADRYDNLAATHGFKRPFLKMDTQGLDLEVFQGAAPRLDRFLGLQSEISLIQIYVGMPTWLDALAEYRKAGFSLCGFFPVSSDNQLRAVELDAVLVRG